MKPPSTQSPFARCRCYLHRRDVHVSSEGVTPPSSLLRTHAPILLPLLDFGTSLVLGVFAGCYRPRLLTGPSRRYSANLSWVARSYATAVPSSAYACFFPDVIGLPLGINGSASRFSPRSQLFVECFSRLQTFRYVQATQFARPPGCSHRCGYAVGQPGLLHPGRTCFVASARTGYPSRPNTGN